MLDRLEAFEGEHREVEARLSDPEVAADNKRFVELSRRYRELSEIVGAGRRLKTATEDLEVLQEFIAEAAADEKDDLRQDAQQAEAEIEEAETELRLLLLPKDPNDGRNVIIEIRGAEGGEEANLFARDLFEMYKAYAEDQKWKFEILGAQNSDLGGFSDVTFTLKGDSVWTRMKFEAGPHRVQRVPVTESQGRVHTSSATVSVLPEAQEVEVDIDTNDLQIDTFRSSGAGGQHVNTTDSAVRMTHKPTGVVVSMQDEKSQLQNRARALVVLRSRLLQMQQEQQRLEASAARKDQIGGGGRSEKIRTYNFKENRVTDHRIGLTLYRLDKVLAGDLGEVSDALVQDERTHQLQSEVGGEARVD
ncbi:MAG: peptide chain release factor 1 [Acidimicrobiales bacterium]|jgi:peptide chain release factor 1